MSNYQALYRVWRPQSFQTMVGQEQNVTALRHAVQDGKLSHAYLFCGPRGTGKTSLAKILARAVNCEQPQAGEPCNQCSSCLDISAGSFMDVIEIDAASNRGIDEIRDLREKVRILPAQGKKKVYIIDEVHMLTNEAFNALLKTLEEPPDYIIFILATTEVHKIPATILSRCQKYSFHNFSPQEVQDHLLRVAEASDMRIDMAAVQLISRRSNGGMRDALGMLDQLQSYKGSGQDIGRADVLEVLGLVDETFIADLVDAAIAQDLGLISQLLDEAMRQGKEALLLMRESALYLRDLMLYAELGDTATLAMVGDQGRERLKQQSQQLAGSVILSGLRQLLEGGEKMRFNESQRFLMEYHFFELARIFNQNQTEVSKSGARASKPAIETEAVPTEGRAKPDRNEAREAIWKQILALVRERRVPTHALLSPARLLGSKGDRIFIAYKNIYKFHKERMEEEENRQLLQAVLHEIFKRDMDVEFVFINEEQSNDLLVKEAIEHFGEDIVNIKD